jgi:hypothetical protein
VTEFTWQKYGENEGGRERGHRYMSLSLYQDEPSRLPILATAIATWYVELAQRSYIHVLGGGALEILHKINV